MVLSAIKKALKAKGIDQKYAEKVKNIFNVQKEEDIQAAVDNFSANVLPSLVEASEEAKKAAEEAAKKAIEEYEAKYKLKDGKQVEPEPPTPNGADDAIAKLIEAQNKKLEELQQQFQSAQKEQEKSVKMATIATRLKDAGMPENWAKLIDVDGDLDTQFEELKGQFIDIQQKTINDKVKSGELSLGREPEPQDKSVEDWAKIMNGEQETKNVGVASIG